MILKNYKLFSYYDLKPFKQEFNETRTNENTKRFEVLSFILLVVDVLLIAFDWLVYKTLIAETTSYLYLYYSHLIIFFTLSTLLIWFKFNKKRKNASHKKFFIYASCFIIISWCIFLGINSISFSGGIGAYIICMLCSAALFFMTPLQSFFIYSISLSAFLYGLTATINTPAVLYSNLINAVVTIILAYIISILNYSYYCKDFLNNKHILQSKELLETTNEKLIEYEKVRTDFFTNISHELRTPLNVIYSAEQMLNDSFKNKDFNDVKVSKYTKMIKQNTYRLLRLINNLIDITKIDSASFKVQMINLDIVKIVEDISMSVADYIEHNGITLIFDTEIEEKVIACNPDNIERMMLNLLSNAVKYGSKNGSIFVNIFLEPNTVCISVKDTGIGIPKNMCSSIFDRFIQVDNSLKRTSEGSGIGLSLVKSLVEMHDGNISVKSKYGEGSEFIIRLPDLKIPETTQQINLSQFEERPTNRINIEFSDIYL